MTTGWTHFTFMKSDRQTKKKKEGGWIISDFENRRRENWPAWEA